MGGVYALKQPHSDGSEWIQEFDSREEAAEFQSHSGGVLVRREQVPGQPGLWWVEVKDNLTEVCRYCGDQIVMTPDYDADTPARWQHAVSRDYRCLTFAAPAG